MTDFAKTLIKLVGLSAFCIIATLTYRKITDTNNSTAVQKQKHDAIIRISRKDGQCSAFVVSDTKAITAGHCIFFSKSDIKEKNKMVKDLKSHIKKINKHISELKCNKSRRGSEEREMCDFIHENLKVRKAELTRKLKYLNKLKPDVFSITTTQGIKVKVKATAQDRQLSYRDYGVITGDFKEFNKIVVKKNFDVLPGQVLSSCGFAEAKLPVTCTTFVAQGNLGFQYMGKGYLVKGMSGGPVLDSNGEAVGINTMVVDTMVVMTPTVGVIEAL